MVVLSTTCRWMWPGRWVPTSSLPSTCSRTSTMTISRPLSFLKGLNGVSSWLKYRPDIAKYNEMRKSADVYINPNLGKYDVMSFTPKAINAMIDMGESAAKKKYKELVKVAKKCRKGRARTRK